MGAHRLPPPCHPPAPAGANYSAELIGVQDMPKSSTKLQLDFSSLLGPLFYTWVVQMLLPIFLMQLVYEKERRLRMMMKMHGLGDRAYWAVTYAWFFTLYVLYMAVFIGFGSAIGLNMFRKNDYGACETPCHAGGVPCYFLLSCEGVTTCLQC